MNSWRAHATREHGPTERCSTCILEALSAHVYLSLTCGVDVVFLGISGAGDSRCVVW